MLAAALDSEPNWGQILSLASTHRLLPSLYAALQGRNDVPASIRSALSARFLTHSRRVLRFSAALSAILGAFAAGEIEVILHKGPALAQRLYGDSSMREFGDLDLLVHTQDVSRARAVLCDLGFRPHLELTRRQEREYLHTGYEYAFASSLGQNIVELQWQILPRFYAVEFQPEELFRRSVEIELEGERARMLCDEDLLLTLCVHAAKHCWPQLGMVRDIATLARESLAWDWVIGQAKSLGISRILTVSLVLGRNLLGTALPSQLPTGAGFRRSELLAAVIQQQVIAAVEPNTESLAYFRFMMRLREKWRHRLQFAARLVFAPSVGEWNAIHLPDNLFPLYRGVRLLRLLRRGY